jgi:hypothetical protein
MTSNNSSQYALKTVNRYVGWKWYTEQIKSIQNGLEESKIVPLITCDKYVHEKWRRDWNFSKLSFVTSNCCSCMHASICIGMFLLHSEGDWYSTRREGPKVYEMLNIRESMKNKRTVQWLMPSPRKWWTTHMTRTLFNWPIDTSIFQLLLSYDTFVSKVQYSFDTSLEECGISFILYHIYTVREVGILLCNNGVSSGSCGCWCSSQI